MLVQCVVECKEIVRNLLITKTEEFPDLYQEHSDYMEVLKLNKYLDLLWNKDQLNIEEAQ